MQPTLCSKCKKNVAVVFISRQNEKGEMVGLGVGGVACNLRDLKKLIARGHAVEKVLPLLTRNVARGLEMKGKGEVAAGLITSSC